MCFLWLLAYLLIMIRGKIYKPWDMQANVITLYQNSNHPLLYRKFNLSLTNNYILSPTVTFGIQQYKMNDQFFFEDFISKVTQSQATYFIIQAFSGSFTSVLTFSISYLIMSNNTDIYSKWLSISKPINICSGSGARYSKLVKQLMSAENQTLASPFLTGFYITSNTMYMLKVYAFVNNNNSYTLQIWTSFDCQILRIDLFILFYSIQMNKNYVINAKSIHINSINATIYSTIIDNYLETFFILGISGFSGATKISKINFQWQQYLLPDKNLSINIQTAKLQSISYSFFQIGSKNPKPSTSVIIIENIPNIPKIAAIATIIIFIILITILLYMSRRRQKVHEEKEVPEVFQELPSYI